MGKASSSGDAFSLREVRETAENEVKYYIRIDGKYIQVDIAAATAKVKTAGKAINSELERQGKQSAQAVGNAAQESAKKIASAASSGATSLSVLTDEAGRVRVELNQVDGGALEDVSSQAADAKDALEETAEKAKGLGAALKEQVGGAAKEAVEGLAGKAGGLGGLMTGLAEKASPAGAAFLNIGAAAAGIGAMGVEAAGELQGALSDLQISTGAADSEMAAYEETLRAVYENNYGDSYSDVAGAVGAVTKELEGLDGADLQNVTESALFLKDQCGYEIPESVRAADAMIKNFGVDGEYAMALIAKGSQENLDASGDFIGSISTYSEEFAKMGLSVDDMFHMFEAGAENGNLSMEEIGSAVQESAANMANLSDSARGAFASLGLDAEDTAAMFAAGGESAQEALALVGTKLGELEDPIERNRVGAELFGSLWEDLGPGTVEQLAAIGDEAYTTTDALDTMKSMDGGGLTDQLEGLKRGLTDNLLVPIGESILPMLDTLMEALEPITATLGESLTPVFEVLGETLNLLAEPLGSILTTFVEMVAPLGELLAAVLTPLLDVVKALLEPITAVLDAVMGPLNEMLDTIWPVLDDLANTLMPLLADMVTSLIAPLSDLLTTAVAPLMDVVQALLTPLLDLVQAILPPLAELFKSLIPVFGLVLESLKPIIEYFTSMVNTVIEYLSPVLSDLSALLGEKLSEAFQGLSEVVGNIKGVFEGFIEFITGVFSGDWEKAWNGVKSIFSNILEGLKNIFKRPINAIIDGINGFIRGVNSIRIPDWVPLVGGKGFHINPIDRLKVGLDFVPNDMFPAFLDYGERVMTASQNARFNALGGLTGMERALSASMRAMPPISAWIWGEAAGMDTAPNGTGMVETSIVLDGREVARTVTPYISKQQGWRGGR